MTALGGGTSRRHTRRRQLNDEAADHVRQLIINGQLQSGERIRPEALALELEMSATPVREGLLSLRGEGFLVLEPRKGFVVAPLTADDIRDLFRVRALIAGELAYLAASRLDDAQLAELSGVHGCLIDAIETKSSDDMELYNDQFHQMINTAAGSAKLAWTYSVSTRNVPRNFYSVMPGWPSVSIVQHAEILDALKRRDADGSREASENHFDYAGKMLADQFEQMRANLSA